MEVWVKYQQSNLYMYTDSFIQNLSKNILQLTGKYSKMTGFSKVDIA